LNCALASLSAGDGRWQARRADSWLKALQEVAPIHKAQLLSYMKPLDVPLGLLFNFHQVKLADAVSRLLLPGANQP
jgi:hypothetical protein